MATSTTSTVYIHVIEDVINKVREEFVNSGTPDSVLLDLQGMWEAKMMAAGAVSGPIDRSSAQKPAPPGGGPTPVHDLNVPYEGTEEYETPTAEMLFPPTPLQTPIQTPLPGTADNSMYNIPTGPSEYSTPAPENGSSASSEPRAGRPGSYMTSPSPWMNQRPPLDVNVAYMENREEAERGNSQQHATQPSGKRKREDLGPPYQTDGFVPQQDGSADATDATSDAVELEIILGKSLHNSDILKATKGKMTQVIKKGSPSRIPQVDGPTADPYDDMLSTPNIYGVVNEDYNVVNTPAPDLPPATPAVAAPNVGEGDDDEEPLNENDDDDEDIDDVDDGEELNTQHLVLAQFDKVTRTKSRWKCTLKDGIMRINNKDILFNKLENLTSDFAHEMYCCQELCPELSK